MTWLDAVLASFATYYLALSVSRQEGPWRVFERLRSVWTNEDWKGRGVRCLVCVSLYTAALMAAGLWGLGRIDGWTAIMVWPGLAGASVVIDRYWQR